MDLSYNIKPQVNVLHVTKTELVYKNQVNFFAESYKNQISFMCIIGTESIFAKHKNRSQFLRGESFSKH